jgi:hypothetical protein
MYDIYLAAGTTYSISATGISNNMDVTLGVYGPGGDYYGYYGYTYLANSNGANGSEYLLVTPSTAGWYCAVVMKSGSESYGISGNYTFNFIANPGIPPVNTLVIEPWTNSNSIFLAWNHVNQDSLGDPMPFRRYVVYRSTDINMVPLPADSIGGTTDSTFVDSAAPDGRYFYRVKVKPS